MMKTTQCCYHHEQMKDKMVRQKGHLPMIWIFYILLIAQVVLVVRNLPANAGNLKTSGSTPGSGRSPGGGHDNPLQYSCPENPNGQRSLVCYSPQGCTQLDMTKVPYHGKLLCNQLCVFTQRVVFIPLGCGFSI